MEVFDYQNDINNLFFQKLLKKTNIRQPVKEISEKTKTDKGQVSKILNNKIPVSDNFIKKFSEAYDIDLNEIENKTLKSEVKAVDFDEFMEAEYLPVKAQAGYLVGLEENHPIELKKMLVPKEFEKGFFKVIEIEGDSMNDGTPRSICDGDKLLLKEVEGGNYLQKTLPYRTNLFVIVSKEGIVCKQIIGQDIDKECITVHSFNLNHADYDICFDDIYQLFYVKKLVERKIKF